MHFLRVQGFILFNGFLEACTSLHEDSITCPLEVSELEPHENNLSDVDNKVLVNNLVVVFMRGFLLRV